MTATEPYFPYEENAAKLVEKWSKRQSSIASIPAIQPQHARAVMQFDQRRVAQGKEPLSDNEAAQALGAIAGSPPVQEDDDSDLSIGDFNPMSILHSAGKDLGNILTALPQLPMGLVREVQALDEIPEQLAQKEGEGANQLEALLSAPGVRIALPGAYVGEKIAAGEAGDLADTPVTALLDVLPYAKPLKLGAKTGKAARAGFEMLPDGARIPIKRAKRKMEAAGLFGKEGRDAVRDVSIADRMQTREHVVYSTAAFKKLEELIPGDAVARQQVYEQLIDWRELNRKKGEPPPNELIGELDDYATAETNRITLEPGLEHGDLATVLGEVYPRTDSEGKRLLGAQNRMRTADKKLQSQTNKMNFAGDELDKVTAELERQKSLLVTPEKITAATDKLADDLYMHLTGPAGEFKAQPRGWDPNAAARQPYRAELALLLDPGKRTPNRDPGTMTKTVQRRVGNARPKNPVIKKADGRITSLDYENAKKLYEELENKHNDLVLSKVDHAMHRDHAAALRRIQVAQDYRGALPQLIKDFDATTAQVEKLLKQGRNKDDLIAATKAHLENLLDQRAPDPPVRLYEADGKTMRPAPQIRADLVALRELCDDYVRYQEARATAAKEWADLQKGGKTVNIEEVTEKVGKLDPREATLMQLYQLRDEQARLGRNNMAMPEELLEQHIKRLEDEGVVVAPPPEVRKEWVKSRKDKFPAEKKVWDNVRRALYEDKGQRVSRLTRIRHAVDNGDYRQAANHIGVMEKRIRQLALSSGDRQLAQFADQLGRAKDDIRASVSDQKKLANAEEQVRKRENELADRVGRYDEAKKAADKAHAKFWGRLEATPPTRFKPKVNQLRLSMLMARRLGIIDASLTSKELVELSKQFADEINQGIDPLAKRMGPGMADRAREIEMQMRFDPSAVAAGLERGTVARITAAANRSWQTLAETWDPAYTHHVRTGREVSLLSPKIIPDKTVNPSQYKNRSTNMASYSKDLEVILTDQHLQMVSRYQTENVLLGTLNKPVVRRIAQHLSDSQGVPLRSVVDDLGEVLEEGILTADDVLTTTGQQLWRQTLSPEALQKIADDAFAAKEINDPSLLVGLMSPKEFGGFGWKRSDAVKSVQEEAEWRVRTGREADLNVATDKLIAEYFDEMDPFSLMNWRKGLTPGSDSPSLRHIVRQDGSTMLYPSKVYVPKGVGKIMRELVPKERNALIAAYDKGLGVFRASMLGLSPRFHIYNVVGGAIMLAAEEGLGAFKHWKEARDMVTGGRDLTWRELVKEGVGGAPTLRPESGLPVAMSAGAGVVPSEVLRQVRIDPVANLQFSKGGTVASMLRRAWEGTGNFVEKSFKFNELVDEMYRSIAYLSGKKKVAGKGATAADAHRAGIESANKVLQDWDSFLPWERQSLRLIVPFMGWMKHILRYTYNYAIDHPYRASIVAKMGQTYMNDQLAESGLPERFADMFWLGEPGEDGRQLSFSAGGGNPFRDVGNFFSLAGAMSQLSPLFQGALEALGVDPMTAKGRLYPEIQYNPETGRPEAVTPNPAQAMLTSFIPLTEIPLGLTGFSKRMRELRRDDPDAWAGMIMQRAGIPFSVRRRGKAEEISKAALARQTVGSRAINKAIKTGDWTEADKFKTVFYEGELVDVQELKEAIQQAQARGELTVPADRPFLAGGQLAEILSRVPQVPQRAVPSG